MNIDRLSTQGVLGFEQLLSLDLSALPTGLIAVVGPNGAGKSALMELPMAALYRQFPTRATRPLVDYASGRDSFIEMAFSVGERSLVSRVALDAVSRQSEAVLCEVTAGGGAPRVLSDGKVNSYDRLIAALLPSPELVLASVFAAQNRAGSFVTQDRKARKQLFAQLLGLERYERLAETARGAVQRIEAQRLRARAYLEALARETSPTIAAALEDQRRTGIARLTEARAACDDAGEAVARLEARAQALSSARPAHAAAVQRVSQATATGARLTEQARKGRQALDDLAATTQRALARVTADRDGVLAALDAKVANNGRVLADRDRILAAVEEARVADAAIETAAASRQAAVAAQTRAHAAVTEATATLGVVRAEAQHAARLRQDAALLDTVPCGGAAPYTGCAFLQQAIVARQTIAAWPDRAAAVARATETLAAAQATAQEAASQLQDAEATAQAAGRERQALTATVALVPRLEAAEARLAELAQERRDLLTATAATAVRVQQEADDRRAGLEQDLVALGTELAQVDLTAAQVQVAALADQVALADAVGGELAVARQTREAAATTVARLEAEQQALDARQAAYSARCAERARVETWSTTLDTWLLEWQWLAKALGRDGLPVLEIDAAGPTVSSVANDLLHACFDGRFTLDLVTQEAKTSGKGLKETFELKVFDNARGGEARDLADLSGGEQIVVDEALKGALAIVLNQRMGTPLQTVFRDETTAPLDGDNALRYVQMLRRMCTLGGFTRIYYVSHNRDASAQADAQIVVHDGTADVRLPPYPAAA